jgi:hypothetical protein
MLLAMGMKLLMSHNTTPTTTSTMTMFNKGIPAKGIFFHSPNYLEAIRCPIAGGWRKLCQPRILRP